MPLIRLSLAAVILLCLTAAASAGQPRAGGAATRPATRPAMALVRTPVTVPANVTLEANISYDDKYPDCVLDIMYPKAASPEKRPGVVVFHGGGWIQSTKETTMNAACNSYLEKGFVVCNIEYRVANLGASPAKAPAAVVDALNATKWFVDHADKYNLDVNRLVSTGFSAGGHLALMVGMVTPEANLGPVVKVAAIINGYGPPDVNDLLTRRTDWAMQWLPEQPGRLEIAKQLSPMTYIRKGLPPIFTVQGANDNTVPVAQNVKMTAALKEAGVDAEMVTIPGAGHGFTTQWPQVHGLVFDFLTKRGVMK